MNLRKNLNVLVYEDRLIKFQLLTQQKTERKAKNIAPMMFDLAKENISSDCRHEFAIKMNAMAQNKAHIPEKAISNIT